MTTLVISTPWGKKDKAGNNIGKPGQSHSWETYFTTGIGLGYVLYQAEYNKLRQSIIAGSGKLVMLRQGSHKRRAEARLINLVNTQRPAGNGGCRYDVYFAEQKQVPYVYLPNEKLKWNGVKVF